MEYYTVNGVAQRWLCAYSTAAMGVLQVRAYVLATGTGVRAGIDINFFIRCTFTVW